MRTANNNFTVEALVAKYHNYVKEHCSKRQYLVRDENGNFVELSTPSSPSGDAGPQLLITLYSMVAGENAKHNIVEPLSKYSSAFFKNALTTEELTYLCEHFREAVSYEFLHRDEWIAGRKSIYGEYSPVKEKYPTLDYIIPRNGDTVYIEDDTLGDAAVLFPQCIILCDKYDEDSALKRIRLFAESIQLKDVNDILEESIDVVISVETDLPFFDFKGAEKLYTALAENGSMIIFCRELPFLIDKSYIGFRSELISRRNIKYIIKGVDDLSLFGTFAYTIVIEKNEHSNVKFIDKTTNKSFEIESSRLNAKILLPGYYFAERPDNGMPLSELLEGYKYPLPPQTQTICIEPDADGLSDIFENSKPSLELYGISLEQPVIFPQDLGCSYKDADLSYRHFKKVSEYEDFVQEPPSNTHNIGFPSILLYGNSKNIYAGIVSKREIPYVVLDVVSCFTAKKGVDLRYVAALLFNPIVAKQISSIYDDFCQYGQTYYLSEFLDIIIVPQHDDKEKLVFLANASDNAIREIKEETTNNIENKISVMKADYINEVRMRKHDMMPHILQIESAENLMRHYMESTNDIVELKQHLLTQIDRVGNARSIISDIVVHLNDEEKFGTTEIVNIDKFLKDVELNHDDSENFTVEYDCDRDSFMKIGIAITNIIEEWGKVKKQGVSYVDFVRQQCKVNLPLYVEIAPIDLRRMVTNIIENARKHAFTDKSRRDYYLGIDLSLNEKTGMYQIDFSNNGNPLPEGMTKEKYGIRGEKAGKTAGTGSGGYIVKSIAEHYGGDYDVFTKEGITTIRIYLPLANKV